MLTLLGDFAEAYAKAMAELKDKELATDAAVEAMLIAAEEPTKFRVRAFKALQGMTKKEAEEAQRLAGEIFDEARNSETVPAEEADGEGAPGKRPRPRRSSRGSSAGSSASARGKSDGTSPSPSSPSSSTATNTPPE